MTKLPPKGSLPEQVVSHDEVPQEDGKKVPLMVRFDRALLKRVDAAAKNPRH